MQVFSMHLNRSEPFGGKTAPKKYSSNLVLNSSEQFGIVLKHQLKRQKLHRKSR